MRKALIGLACVSGMLLAGTASASPINCKVAMKNLGVPGRTHQDVADTMGVGVDDIKKCEAEAKEEQAKKAAESGAAAGQAAGAAAGASAGEKAGAAAGAAEVK
jgi:hypothetical protein